MNAKEILKAWLTERGYDGLWNGSEECACLVGNLAPCEGDPGNCEPGYKVTCSGPRCDFCRESGWHMQSQKPIGGGDTVEWKREGPGRWRGQVKKGAAVNAADAERKPPVPCGPEAS